MLLSQSFAYIDAEARTIRQILDNQRYEVDVFQREYLCRFDNFSTPEEKFKEQKSQFEKIKQNYESKIKYINHLQSSILDAAFSGKLVN